MYVVSITRSAQKDIRALDRPIIPRILETIRRLSDEPRPPGCRKLVGTGELWRVRVGDYRVVYRINDSARSVEIVIVRHRRDAYE